MATALPPVLQTSPGAERSERARQLAGTLNSLARGNGAAGSDAGDRRAEIREAAEGFEAMFVNELLKEMFPEGEGSLFGTGTGSGTYQQLFLTELSKVIADNGQLGLADIIERDVAARAGLTDESLKRTEPIPGRALGRPLPQPLRRASFVAKAYGQAGDNRPQIGGELSFLQPVAGRISSTFGERHDPFSGSKRQHHGLDIAAPEGTPVRAAADGTVVYSGRKGGYGNVVIIEHADGYQTRYAHNADNAVSKGDTVRAGETVATVGSTGRSTGPHLHFEVRRHGNSVDPETLIGAAD